MFKPILLALNLCCLLLLGAAAAGQEAEGQEVDEPLYPEITRKDTGLATTFFATNPFDYPVTVSIDLPTLENARTNKPLPAIVTLPPRKKNIAVVTAKRIDPKKKFRALSKTEWTPGTIDAKHDDHVYALPYLPGHSYRLGQGFNGSFSHEGKNALDWDMPEGTLVCAARGGVVVKVVEGFSEGGPSPALRPKANAIYVLHDDQTIGHYVHLQKDGVDVEVGQQVKVGDVLGRSGSTGFSKGPHLHFEVFTAAADGSAPLTIPIQLATVHEPAAELREGEYYQRPFEDQAIGEKRIAANAFTSAVLQKRNVETPDVLDTSAKFSAADTLHVTVQIGVPVERIRLEFWKQGGDAPLLANELGAGRTRRNLTLPLSSHAELRGDLVVKVFLDDAEVASLPLHVE